MIGQGAAFYSYLTGQVGSVLALVNAQGQIVNQYDYDAFGNLLAPTSCETVEHRPRFHSRECDSPCGH